MYKYLPSKKFVYILGAIIVSFLIILGVDALVENQKNRVSDKKIVDEALNSSFKEFLEVDTDADGLKDWEEALWKTDPKNPDTDGDGTNDWDEVKVNRDPTKKGPGDEIDPAIIAENKKAEEEFAALNPTEQFSRVLFSQFIDAKNSAGGRALTSADKQAVLDNMISDLSKTTVTIKYRVGDLQILSEENALTIKDYGNKFGFIILEKFSKYAGREILYLAQATANNDEQALDVLELIIKEYNETIAYLALLPVPEKAVFIHVDILNNLENMKTSIEGMQYIFTDPATAITSLSQYQSSANELFRSLDTLILYFKSNNVNFGDTDPGILITNFKQQK